MLLVSKRAKLFASIALFAFIFAVLRQDALKAVMLRKEDGKVEEIPGGKDDLSFDEKAENGTRSKLNLAIKEMT